MSSKIVDDIELVGAIVAILAAIRPLLLAIIEFTQPHLNRFSARTIKNNFKIRKGILEHIDFLYCDPRRLTAWCSRQIMEQVTRLLIAMFACGGVWLSYKNFWSNEHYLDLLAEILFSMISLILLFRILAAQQIIISLSQPKRYSIKQLKAVDKAILRGKKYGVSYDVETIELGESIKKIVTYGEWNSVEPDFNRNERVKALTGILPHRLD